jgi:hypothetical protein
MLLETKILHVRAGYKCKIKKIKGKNSAMLKLNWYYHINAQCFGNIFLVRSSRDQKQ